MTPDEFRADILRGLESQVELDVLHGILLVFANTGGTRDEARAVLEDLRGRAQKDAVEDRILEVLDFVEGFCHPSARVWKNA